MGGVAEVKDEALTEVSVAMTKIDEKIKLQLKCQFVLKQLQLLK